jgi:hypothetical protein
LPLGVSAPSFLKGGRDKDIITSTSTHWMKESPLPDMTVQEMYLFLAIVVQMGHDQRDVLKDYWSTLERYFVAFYGKTMK